MTDQYYEIRSDIPLPANMLTPIQHDMLSGLVPPQRIAFRPHELHKMLPFCPQHIYNMMDDGRLEYLDCGTYRLIMRDALIRCLKGETKKTQQHKE